MGKLSSTSRSYTRSCRRPTRWNGLLRWLGFFTWPWPRYRHHSLYRSDRR